MAGIKELIAEIGDENVKVQALHQCMEDAKYNKGITTIKFSTDGLSPTDLVENNKTALILWVKADDFNQALAKINKR